MKSPTTKHSRANSSSHQGTPQGGTCDLRACSLLSNCCIAADTSVPPDGSPSRCPSTPPLASSRACLRSMPSDSHKPWTTSYMLCMQGHHQDNHRQPDACWYTVAGETRSQLTKNAARNGFTCAYKDMNDADRPGHPCA